MFPFPAPTSWVSEGTWRCLLSLMTTYFTTETVEVLSAVDVSPLVEQSEWALYVSNVFKAPTRPASVDAVLIGQSLGPTNLAGRYGHVAVVTETLESALPLWTESRFHNTVVLKDNGTHINAYTWFPYRRETCNQTPSLELIDTCVGGQWTRDLYPDKVPRKFGGCPVYYKTTHYPPDVTMLPNGSFSGREVKLLQILAEHLDLTVHFRPPARQHSRPTIHGDTAVAALKQGQADIAFASMVLLTDYGHYVDSLPTYREHPVVWMFPRAWPRDRRSGIYSGFSMEMWMYVLTIQCAAGVVTLGIAIVEQQRWPWLDLFAVLVASPVARSSSFVLRSFLTILQLYSLHIAWFYQAVLLANLCKTPMQKQVTNSVEAADAGLTAYILSFLRFFLNNSDHDKWEKILAPDKHFYSLHLPYEKAVEERTGYLLALLVQDGTAMRRKFRRNLSSMVYIEPFVNNPIVAYGSRGSPLTPLYAMNMLHLIESGIFSHFSMLEGGFKDLPSKAESSSAQVLQLEPLQSAFYFLIFNLILVFFVYIGEVITGHYCTIKIKASFTSVRNIRRKKRLRIRL